MIEVARQPITVSTNIEAAVEDLVNRGKARGFVTWEEMNETLPDNAIDPSKLELILLRLEEEKIETLDEIAYGNSGQFENARDAITAGPILRLRREGLPRARIKEIQAIRRRHADLYRRWTAETLSPRELRIALVDYYITQGQNAIKQRFFSAGR